MVESNASREVPAPLDRIWDVISDRDSEPRYWRDLRAVYNISRDDNVVEGIPLLFRGIIRERIAEVTKETLDRIARAVQ